MHQKYRNETGVVNQLMRFAQTVKKEVEEVFDRDG